jgi:hypothetical protein
VLSSEAPRGTNWLLRPAFAWCNEKPYPLLYRSRARDSIGSGCWPIRTGASTTPLMKRPGRTSAIRFYARCRRSTRQLAATSWPKPTSTGWRRARAKGVGREVVGHRRDLLGARVPAGNNIVSGGGPVALPPPSPTPAMVHR